MQIFFKHAICQSILQVSINASVEAARLTVSIGNQTTVLYNSAHKSDDLTLGMLQQNFSQFFIMFLYVLIYI